MASTINRTQKEKVESNLVKKVYTSFNQIFRKHFGHQERVVFAIYDKLKNVYKYADISFNNLEGCLQVDINPKLMEEKPKVIEETGKRMAIKMHLALMNKDYSETSKDYVVLSTAFHLWNYNTFPETPHKWDVYKCNKCGRRLAVYSKRLPLKSPLTSVMQTPFHKSNPKSETENPHQGGYAYGGKVELTNWEFQEILDTMNAIIKDYDHGRDTKARKYQKDEY